jgi:hypothetical protein
MNGKVSLISRVVVCDSFISPAAVALSHVPEHEPARKLLGQRANYARVPQLENGMDTDPGTEQLKKTNVISTNYWCIGTNGFAHHHFNCGLALTRAEEKLNVVSEISWPLHNQPAWPHAVGGRAS